MAAEQKCQRMRRRGAFAGSSANGSIGAVSLGIGIVVVIAIGTTDSKNRD